MTWRYLANVWLGCCSYTGHSQSANHRPRQRTATNLKISRGRPLVIRPAACQLKDTFRFEMLARHDALIDVSLDKSRSCRTCDSLHAERAVPSMSCECDHAAGDSAARSAR